MEETITKAVTSITPAEGAALVVFMYCIYCGIRTAWNRFFRGDYTIDECQECGTQKATRDQ